MAAVTWTWEHTSLCLTVSTKWPRWTCIPFPDPDYGELRWRPPVQPSPRPRRRPPLDLAHLRLPGVPSGAGQRGGRRGEEEGEKHTQNKQLFKALLFLGGRNSRPLAGFCPLLPGAGRRQRWRKGYNAETGANAQGELKILFPFFLVNMSTFP